MSGVRFDSTTGSARISRAPLRPAPGIALLQDNSVSAAGVRFGYPPRSLERPLTLRWQGITSADLAALLAFLSSHAQGMARPFFYTDNVGQIHLVRCASDQLDHSEIAWDRHHLTLELLETA